MISSKSGVRVILHTKLITLPKTLLQSCIYELNTTMNNQISRSNLKLALSTDLNFEFVRLKK